MEIFFSITNGVQWFAFVMSFIFLSLSLWLLLFRVIPMLRKEKHKIENPYDTPNTPEEAKDQYLDDWQMVKRNVQSMQDSEWKVAVISADKLVDEVLRVKGYQGESMGERLMSIDPNRFMSLQGVWDAHKLRNQIVHDIQANVDHSQAMAAVDAYENFLKELGFFS
jgi:hypothetical protein